MTMPERLHSVPLLASVYDDGSVTFEVVVPARGDGEDAAGRATGLDPSAYVTLVSLSPGQSRKVIDRIQAARNGSA